MVVMLMFFLLMTLTFEVIVFIFYSAEIGAQAEPESCGTSLPCVCLLLQYLLQRACVFITAGPSTSRTEDVSITAVPITKRCVCVCLLLQYLLQSCSRRGGGGMEDMCVFVLLLVCVFITAGPIIKLCVCLLCAPLAEIRC
jgi:hypothetical protein